jgi:hypothetical protein
MFTLILESFKVTERGLPLAFLDFFSRRASGWRRLSFRNHTQVEGERRSYQDLESIFHVLATTFSETDLSPCRDSLTAFNVSLRE